MEKTAEPFIENNFVRRIEKVFPGRSCVVEMLSRLLPTRLLTGLSSHENGDNATSMWLPWSSWFSIVLMLSCYTNSSLAQKDPVVDFCRRFGHQTTVIDRKLYIDGGFINFNPLLSNPTNYTSKTSIGRCLLHRAGEAMAPLLMPGVSRHMAVLSGSRPPW